MRAALAMLLALGLLSGCDTSGTQSTLVGSSVAGGATYTAVATQILGPKCTRCHSEADAKGGVSFSSYASTIASPGAVVPYQPHVSRLFMKTYDGEMPEDGQRLSGAELELLYDWISLGAPNN